MCFRLSALPLRICNTRPREYHTGLHRWSRVVCLAALCCASCIIQVTACGSPARLGGYDSAFQWQIHLHWPRSRVVHSLPTPTPDPGPGPGPGPGPRSQVQVPEPGPRSPAAVLAAHSCCCVCRAAVLCCAVLQSHETGQAERSRFNDDTTHITLPCPSPRRLAPLSPAS